jgi:two-component system nitrogen regulation response regulator GlnG
LGVFTIHLPPLRERGDDLPLLVQHYVRRFSRELGREVRQVAPETLERLRGHAWPGNIRELQSVLKQALLQARGTTLLPAFLPDSPASPAGVVEKPKSHSLTLQRHRSYKSPWTKGNHTLAGADDPGIAESCSQRF